MKRLLVIAAILLTLTLPVSAGVLRHSNTAGPGDATLMYYGGTSIGWIDVLTVDSAGLVVFANAQSGATQTVTLAMIDGTSAAPSLASESDWDGAGAFFTDGFLNIANNGVTGGLLAATGTFTGLMTSGSATITGVATLADGTITIPSYATDSDWDGSGVFYTDGFLNIGNNAVSGGLIAATADLTGAVTVGGAATIDGDLVLQDATNGATWVSGQITELITLSTGGLTTDSAGDLLPANSIIKAVACYVVTEITDTTSWAVGDPTTAARFSATNSTLTVGEASVGLAHQQGGVATDAAGPAQIAAAKLRITATGSNPGAGAVRCTSFFETFTVPTS